jgi:heptosyltransferase-3
VKVLVVRLDSVGDVLLAGPAVAATTVVASVDLLVSSIGAPAARLLPGVEEVITFDAPWILDPAPPVDQPAIDALVATVAAGRYSAAAILTSSHQSCLPTALLLRLAGVRRIAAVSHDFAGGLLDHRIKGDPDLHEVERGLAVVAELGISPLDGVPRLAVDVDVPAAIRGRVVLHPGAAVPARTLAAERWAEVALELTRRGHEVVVTGGGGEVELCTMVADATARAPVVLARDDLAGFARLLGSAEVVVTGNTGPAHLAAAVGRAVVSVFPPTVPAARWAPWGVPHVLLGDQDVVCAGCRARRCPHIVPWCTAAVTAEAVADAVAALGARPADGNRRLTGVVGELEGVGA